MHVYSVAIMQTDQDFIFNVDVMHHPLSTIWPPNLRKATQCVQGDSEEVTSHTLCVCPNENCSATSAIKDSENGRCTQVHFQRVCLTSLGHYTNLAHGKKKWKAYKSFQFFPPSSTLKRMFQTQQFNELLQLGQERFVKEGVIQDIKDGRVWKEFQTAHSFTGKHDIGLILSVDWSRPFKRGEYKLGAILLTVLNIPREQRSKKKWTLLAGIYKECILNSSTPLPPVFH